MSQTVARLLAESLEAHDVDQIYCVPGESYVGLTSALIERNSMRLVVCRHEAGAGFMAVADGRLKGRAYHHEARDASVRECEAKRRVARPATGSLAALPELCSSQCPSCSGSPRVLAPPWSPRS
jgi:hypothetical protein